MGAIEDIAAERRRQIEVEGWTPEHDDSHFRGELGAAAISYLRHVRNFTGDPNGAGYRLSNPPKVWPWDATWWKPKCPRRDLIRAGALIAAEQERLNRLSAQIVDKIERLDRATAVAGSTP